MLHYASKALEAFIHVVPPGDAWRDRGIISVNIHELGENEWALIVVFRDQYFFKYIPDTFGKLRVLKRVSI